MSGLLPVGDRTMSVVGAAMDGIAARQAVIANNVANAATPNYRAKTVEFERSLQAAVNRGTLGTFQISAMDAGGQPKQDGNTVDMTKEMTKLDQAGLMFDALVSAMNFRVSSVRAALSR